MIKLLLISILMMVSTIGCTQVRIERATAPKCFIIRSNGMEQSYKGTFLVTLSSVNDKPVHLGVVAKGTNVTLNLTLGKLLLKRIHDDGDLVSFYQAVDNKLKDTIRAVIIRSPKGELRGVGINDDSSILGFPISESEADKPKPPTREG